MTPWTVARQTSLSIQFSRREYGNGLPLLSPGDLPDPGIKPMSPALAGKFFTTEQSREASDHVFYICQPINNVSPCVLREKPFHWLVIDRAQKGSFIVV